MIKCTCERILNALFYNIYTSKKHVVNDNSFTEFDLNIFVIYGIFNIGTKITTKSPNNLLTVNLIQWISNCLSKNMV